jgi:hypothetical protein
MLLPTAWFDFQLLLLSRASLQLVPGASLLNVASVPSRRSMVRIACPISA